MPTNKPKLNARQKVAKKNLADIVERHPFKIGDPLPPDDVLLKSCQFRLGRIMHKSAMEQCVLSVTDQLNESVQGVCVELEGWLAGEQVELAYMGTYVGPKTWWAMFKQDVLGMELQSKDLKVHEVRNKVLAEVVYPSLRLPKILPEVKGILVRVRGQEPNKEYMTAGVE